MSLKKNEVDLLEKVKEFPMLKWGYIGNFEHWGDDRRLYIWVKNVDPSHIGNTPSIWSCSAKEFNTADYYIAVSSINTFMLGWNAHKASVI